MINKIHSFNNATYRLLRHYGGHSGGPWSSSCLNRVKRNSAPKHHLFITTRAASSLGVPPVAKTTSQGSPPTESSQKELRYPSPRGVSPEEEVNPPVRTLPPPLDLPDRQSTSSTVSYLFQLGRAYGKFYWAGSKAAWSNHQKCAPIRTRLREEQAWFQKNGKTILSRAGRSAADLALLAVELRLYQLTQPQGSEAARRVNMRVPHMTRARFQTLFRDEEDWRKLPQFGVLVALCGEYLPLLVPFMPTLVPRTCRIPKQIEGMLKTREERRRRSYDEAKVPLSEMPVEQIQEAYSKVAADNLAFPHIATKAKLDVCLLDVVVENMSVQQLSHVSTCLGRHSKMWERVGLVPPRPLLVWRLKRRLRYLMTDDLLLLYSRQGVSALSNDELQIACEERGIDVLGRPQDHLRKDLRSWLNAVSPVGHPGSQGRPFGYRFDRTLLQRASAWSST